MDSSTLIAIVIIAIAVIVVVGWLYARRRRSERLRARFGPEYERTVRDTGSATRAEAALEARARKVEKLNIRPLTREESARFSDAWRRVQARFVDEPKAAVADASRLVTEVMSARGYPMADFDQRAADLSVDHAAVVDNYRAARDIGVRYERGEAGTEDLRQAMVHYRTLFQDLLGSSEREGVREQEVVRRRSA